MRRLGQSWGNWAQCQNDHNLGVWQGFLPETAICPAKISNADRIYITAYTSYPCASLEAFVSLFEWLLHDSPSQPHRPGWGLPMVGTESWNRNLA